MKGITVLSLFDGMSCGRLALERAGIKVKQYYASEIDKHAIKVTQHNYPDTIQLGSVTDINGTDLPKIDLLCGGSPCQSFSFAGKMKGMITKCDIEILTLEQYLELKSEGYRFEGQSYLFWEYMRILNEVKPKYFLLENVIMSKKWEKVLSDAIGIRPIMINSALVSAQNRKRLYFTNIGAERCGLYDEMECMIPQPKDKGILLRDILESDVPDKYYLSDKMLNYFQNNSEKMKQQGNGFSFTPTEGFKKANSVTTKEGSRMENNFIVASRGRKPENPKSLEAGLNTEQMLEPRYDGKTNCLTSVQKDNLVMQLNQSTESNGCQPYQQNRVYDIDGISPALMAQMSCGTHAVLIPEATKKGYTEINPGECFDFENPKSETRRGRKMEDKSNCLMAKKTDFMHYTDDFRIRRLTPTECERLQTVPDNEIICIFALCLDQVKNYVNAVEQNPKLLKLALSAEKEELNEFVKLANQNTKQNNQLTKSIVQQGVDMMTQRQINQCTKINQKENNTTVNNAENIVMCKSQNQEEDFVLPNVFINITEGRIMRVGMEELHQKGNHSTIHLIGKKPLVLFGNEIMQLVKDVDAGVEKSKDMSSTSTMLSVLSMNSLEQMLATYYLFAKSAITGFTQDITNQNSLSVQFQINDGYSSIVSDTQRYRMLGNGWTVSVISHIFSYLPKQRD